MCGILALSDPGTTICGSSSPTISVTWDNQVYAPELIDISLFIDGKNVKSCTKCSSLTYTPSPCDFGPGTYPVTASGDAFQVNKGWVVENPGCEESDNCSFINFDIHQYKCGDCDWRDAACFENAVILLARTGNLSQWQNQLTNCRWRRNANCPDYPFINSNVPTRDLYYVSVTNDCGCPGHAVVGEIKDTTISIENFQNWRFIQWGNLNITPGEIETDDDGKQIYQIPLGCGSTDTKVTIMKINALSVTDCDIHVVYSNPLVIFNIDNLGDVTIGT
ncbi:hypothetical protein [uncultured Methanospirillum sp.]|uniref:hypothetical protein n=1 Tax=uncultured Methanospirillum sp. TaxID=262503 RepID=UPI0029C92A27|nr:hypothetical protein [uncultured Methanospirillum sp.]